MTSSSFLFFAVTFPLPSEKNLARRLPSCQQQKNASGFGSFRGTACLGQQHLCVFTGFDAGSNSYSSADTSQLFAMILGNSLHLVYGPTLGSWLLAGSHWTTQVLSGRSSQWSYLLRFLNCSFFFLKPRKPKREHYPIEYKNTCLDSAAFYQQEQCLNS